MVGGEDDAEAVGRQFLEERQHAGLVAQVERGDRLVQHHQPALGGQGAGDERHLLLAAGEFGVRTVGHVRDAHPVQRRLGQFAVAAAGGGARRATAVRTPPGRAR
ncbi:hypothetical protein JCM18897A_51810 [Streptomyces sp. JCM 18897]